MTDFTFTEVKKTKKLFQYISNFYHYYYDKRNLIDHNLHDIDLRSVEIQNLNRKVKEYEGELNQILRKKQEVLCQNEKLLQEAQKCQLELMDKYKAKIQLQEEIKMMKIKQKKSQETLEIYKSNIVKLNNLKTDVEKKLSKYTVLYNTHIDELIKLKEDKQNKVLSIENLIEEKKQILSHKEMLFQHMENQIKQNIQLLETKERYEMLQAEMSVLNAQVKDSEVNFNKVNEECQEARLQAQNVEKELENTKCEYETKIKELRDRHMKFVREKDRAKTELNERIQKKCDIDKEIQEMNEVNRKLKLETDRLVKECQEICKKELEEMQSC